MVSEAFVLGDHDFRLPNATVGLHPIVKDGPEAYHGSEK
jgi:hypothetical protein